jgi:hypothetical protein
MSTVIDTSYKVQTDVDTDSNRLNCKVEEGAIVTTESAVYGVYQNEWRTIYPQNGAVSLGWARYDDGEYTSESKLSLADGVLTIMPNNASNVLRSDSSITFYNSTTKKILGTGMNDVFMLTIVFKASASNANQTYLTIEMDNINGTEYSRLSEDLTFPRGNDIEHNFHNVFQYYVDSDFVSNGATWRIKSTGGSVQVWDIIYFIQRTQNASL